MNFGDSATDAYSKIQLTPYQSKKDVAQDHAIGYVWYDELIVSTKPIAGPNGPAPSPSSGDVVPPAQPTSLHFTK